MSKQNKVTPEMNVEYKEILRFKLTHEQYKVCCDKKTEAPYTGKYCHNTKDGTYTCISCKKELFDSDHKFDSGTGWPSFTLPTSSDAVEEAIDSSFGMRRVEVICANCKVHLGHVFKDGPDKGLRYCINSAALNFKQKKCK